MKFHNIEPNNIENGIGIRVLLWVSGCFHNCKGCQNPITHDPEDGVDFNSESMDEIIEYLKPEWISGITITGGDPLCYYYEETLEIIEKIREVFGDTKTIWIYTGYSICQLLDIALGNVSSTDSNRKSIFSTILEKIDVLCDGKWNPELASKEYHWVGSTNQRVINMKESLKQGKLIFFEEEQRSKCAISCIEADKKISTFSFKVQNHLQ